MQPLKQIYLVPLCGTYSSACLLKYKILWIGRSMWIREAMIHGKCEIQRYWQCLEQVSQCHDNQNPV